MLEMQKGAMLMLAHLGDAIHSLVMSPLQRLHPMSIHATMGCLGQVRMQCSYWYML